MSEQSKSDKAEQNKAIADAVGAAIKEALPAAAAVVAKMNQPPAPEAPVFQSGDECNLCRQKMNACKSKHVMMAVYPQSRRHGKWFQGVKINGVLYLSNSLSHRIPVPEDNNIEYIISQWETQEDEQQNGRQISHDSGSLGTNGRTNQANYPGFRSV